MQITEEVVERFKSFHEQNPNPRVSKFYGIDLIAKKHLGIPNWFPLAYVALLEHGIALQYHKFHGKWQHSKNEILCVDTKIRQELLTKDNRDAVVMGPIFVHARKLYNIQKKENAKGTLVYPIHSAYNYSMEYNCERYIESLLALPKKYHPFTVSIYWLDVIKGVHKIYEKYGIKTVTNGHIYDPDFIKNCLEYISQHQFTTGNELVSTMFYAVEMGVPFFLFGRDPKSEETNPEYRKIIDKDPEVVKLRNVFTQTTASLENSVIITKDQQAIVDFYVGQNSWMSPGEIRKYIYQKTPSIFWRKLISR